MSLHVCINCPITGTDLGEWDSEHPFFKNILQVHKHHDGFQKGTIKINNAVEDTATEFLDENYHKMLHIVIQSCKGPTKSCFLRGTLDEI